MLTRRAVVAGIAAVPLAAATGRDDRLAELERRSGGRLGVAVLDTGSGRRIGWRAGERFPMCSTFKLLAAGFVLARADAGVERLDRAIPVTADEFVGGNSPVTKAYLGGTMTVAALCEAAMTVSDNTAANLLLASFGGPAALTGFLRQSGDSVTRLDRTEPTLNECRPDDPRDTTSPAAMLATLRRLTLAATLSAQSRALLVGWLIANKTGDRRLRAGLPSVWRVGDKTGSSGSRGGTTNDVAIIWPVGRSPLFVTAYLTQSTLDDDGRNAVLAEVGRLVATL